MIDSERYQYIVSKMKKVLINAIYLFTPLWATFAFYGISILPLPRVIIQTLVIAMVVLLLALITLAVRDLFLYEDEWIQILIILLSVFALIITGKMLRQDSLGSFLFLFVSGTLLPVIRGACGDLGNMSGFIKLFILAILTAIFILPAGFLYWAFLEILADIFSIHI